MQNDFDKNLKFTQEHEWVSVKDGIATIGISEYAKNALGDLVFVELPSVGDKFKAGDNFAVVESVKTASEIYSPFSGEVVEVNTPISDNPEIMKNSLEEGWIIKLKIEDDSNVDKLMDEEAYKEFLKGLE